MHLLLKEKEECIVSSQYTPLGCFTSLALTFLNSFDSIEIHLSWYPGLDLWMPDVSTPAGMLTFSILCGINPVTLEYHHSLPLFQLPFKCPSLSRHLTVVPIFRMDDTGLCTMIVGDFLNKGPQYTFILRAVSIRESVSFPLQQNTLNLLWEYIWGTPFLFVCFVASCVFVSFADAFIIFLFLAVVELLKVL